MQHVSDAGDATDFRAGVDRVEALLASYLDGRSLPAGLRDAAKYAVFNGGKRLRPVLALRSCEAAGGEARQAEPAAAALEMIHGFSLVHDDLPAMDDDDYRRGRPTLHRHAGEAAAILAGDGLTTLAFELLTTRAPDPATGGRLVSELATAATEMIAGQVYDTCGGFEATLARDADRLEAIHACKTEALIRAACRMGAISAGAAGDTLAALDAYGGAVGKMFQVVDDLLDVTQSSEHLGKQAHKDQEAGKLTWPGVHGMAATRSEVDRLQRLAHGAVASLGGKAESLRQLCDYMAVRTQ